MAQYEPMFAYLFGLHPWDIDRLTYHQWLRYRDYADRMTKGRGG